MPKKEIRESNFQNAQSEIAKVMKYLEDVKSLYFKPMRMNEEINATDKALGYLGKVIQRLTKRVEMSKALAAKQK